MKYKLLLLSFCFSFSFSAELPNSLIEKKDVIKSEPKVNLSTKPDKNYIEPLIEKKGDLKREFDKIPYNEVELKMIKEIREKRNQEKANLPKENLSSIIKPFSSIKLEKLNNLRIYEEAKICIERATDEYQINSCELQLKNKAFSIQEKNLETLHKERLLNSSK